MREEHFFKHPDLPFAELRHSTGSTVSFKPHMHRTLSIGAVEAGEVIYSEGGKEAVLAPGALVVFNPDSLHTCNPVGEAGRSYYMLHLDVKWCFSVQQSMWKIDCFVPVEQTRIDDPALYGQYCRDMNRLPDEPIPLVEKEQMLFDLVCAVFTAACSPRAERSEPHHDIEFLKKRLSTDLDRDFTLNSLAEEMDANPYRLIRSFKAAVGITPHAYRMNCRIEKARELLRQGWEISQTALECGFFDQSHFHRYFKAMTTVTPQEYKINFLQ